MRTSLVAAIAVILHCFDPAKASVIAPTCDKTDACYKAVLANGKKQPDCGAFFRTTVTPKPKTAVVTESFYKTVRATFTKTVHQTVVRATTIVHTRTAAGIATITETTTNTTTIATTMPMTYTDIKSATEIETITETSTSTTTLPVSTVTPTNIKKRANDCPTASAAPSTLPAYASDCQNTVAYSCACSCIGAKHATTTLPACTTTIFRTMTTTVTKLPITKTITSRMTQKATQTKRSTVTHPTSLITTLFRNATVLATYEKTKTESTMTTITVSTTTTEVKTATDTPRPAFDCSQYGYLVQDQALYQVNLENGKSLEINPNVGRGLEVKSMGYNGMDNYLYAIRVDGALLRIAGDGSSVVLAKLGIDVDSGAFDDSGNFWVSRGGLEWYQIKLDPRSNAYGSIAKNGTSQLDGYSLSDWVYISTQDHYLYSIARNTATQNTAMLRWSATDHSWEVVKNYGNDTLSGDWGALYGCADGTIYASENTSGQIWKFVTPYDNYSKYVVTGAPSENNDGARCAYNADLVSDPPT